MEINEFINLVNTNFTAKDIWSTWTYSKGNEPKDEAEAKRDLEEFISKQREWLREQENKELKFVATINRGNKSIYFHVITNFPDREKLEGLWNKGGRNQVRKLKEDGEYKFSGLAKYVMNGNPIKILLSSGIEPNDSK